jgi:hypothetical protein
VCTLDICSLAAPVSAAAAAVAAAAALTLIRDVLQHLYFYHIPAVSSEQQQQCVCTFTMVIAVHVLLLYTQRGVSRTAVAVAVALHNVLQVSYINGGLHVHEVLSKYINKATLITVVCLLGTLYYTDTLQIVWIQSSIFAASVWCMPFYC